MSKTIQIEKGSETPESLSADTLRSLRQIKANGYYETHQTLGIGGWPEVYKFASNWASYLLTGADSNGNELEDSVIARDDETAIQAFSDKYDLAKLDWYRITERKTTYRQVA